MSTSADRMIGGLLHPRGKSKSRGKSGQRAYERRCWVRDWDEDMRLAEERRHMRELLALMLPRGLHARWIPEDV